MRPYKLASHEAHKFRLKFIKERMNNLGITSYALAHKVGLSKSHLKRILDNEGVPSVTVMDEIYGALDLRPYLIPKELDTTEMNKLDFN